jgi:hypothetical protein
LPEQRGRHPACRTGLRSNARSASRWRAHPSSRSAD